MMMMIMIAFDVTIPLYLQDHCDGGFGFRVVTGIGTGTHMEPISELMG